MFVGHALLAFALVASVASSVTDSQHALTLGVVAAAFATVPDVDMVYAISGVVGALVGGVAGGPLELAHAFWGTGNVVHRGVTHSLVVAPIAAASAAAWVASRRSSRGLSIRALEAALAVVLAAALVAVVTVITSALAGAITFVFASACLGLAELIVRRTDVESRATFVLALFGLASHPFGDMFTGEPPAFLYPIASLQLDTITLHPDPTLHLLAAFGIELATVWAALLVWTRLREGPTLPQVDLRAGAGAAYAASAFLIPAPTLEVSYQFVFSVLAVGLVGLAPRIKVRRRQFTRPGPERAVFTGLTAVTIAAVAYAAVYVSVVG